jgi:peptidoglycan/LPS O-acetylase OafA/YrhL
VSGASATPAPAERPGGRLSALDGLRGWAAVVVVLHHLLEIAKPYLSPGPDRPVVLGSAWWWITETPLKLLTAGHEAVVVFFVLSGLVVALPALRASGPYSWGAFLASRFVRIYLPVWGALLLATVFIKLLPRDRSQVVPHSWMADSNATSLSAPLLVEEATLSRFSFDIVNTLWSLRWEMIFAVLLPLYIVLARALRRRWAVTGSLLAVAAVGGFALENGTLSYLPAFFLGTLVAVNLDGFRGWADRARRSRAFGAIAGAGIALSCLLLIVNWLARPLGSAALTLALTGLSVLGALGLVLLAIAPTPLARALLAPASRWLGRISFSLYLVHVPVLVTLAFLIGDARWPLVALLGVPASLLVGWGFERVVEAPAHRLARRVGGWVGAAVPAAPRWLTAPPPPAREASA